MLSNSRSIDSQTTLSSSFGTVRQPLCATGGPFWSQALFQNDQKANPLIRASFPGHDPAVPVPQALNSAFYSEWDDQTSPSDMTHTQQSSPINEFNENFQKVLSDYSFPSNLSDAHCSSKHASSFQVTQTNPSKRCSGLCSRRSSDSSSSARKRRKGSTEEVIQDPVKAAEREKYLERNRVAANKCRVKKRPTLKIWKIGAVESAPSTRSYPSDLPP